jgi:hypothetical protein
MIGRDQGNPVESRVYGMLWSEGADPTLLAAGQFRAEAELCDWLRAILAARALTVRLQDGGDTALRDAVTKVLRAPDPA